MMTALLRSAFLTLVLIVSTCGLTGCGGSADDAPGDEQPPEKLSEDET